MSDPLDYMQKLFSTVREDAVSWTWDDMAFDAPELGHETVQAVNLWKCFCTADHPLPERVRERVEKVCTQSSTVNLAARQPLIDSDDNSDYIFVFDMYPSDKSSTMMSFKMQASNSLRTYHVGCLEQMSKIRKSLHDMRSSRNTPAYILGALLRIPLIEFSKRVDDLESEVGRLDDNLKRFWTRHGASPNHRDELDQCKRNLIQVQKVLSGYKRISRWLSDPYRGSFNYDDRASDKVKSDVHQYLVTLEDLVEGTTSKISELQQRLDIIQDRINYNQSHLLNWMLAFVSFVLLPANLIAAYYGMNEVQIPLVRSDFEQAVLITLIPGTLMVMAIALFVAIMYVRALIDKKGKRIAEAIASTDRSAAEKCAGPLA